MHTRRDSDRIQVNHSSKVQNVVALYSHRLVLYCSVIQWFIFLKEPEYLTPSSRWQATSVISLTKVVSSCTFQ